jgi:hypothetical protein
MLLTIALAARPRFQEFVREPALTIACVLLVVVSIAWIVVARMISKNVRRSATLRSQAQRRESAPKPPRPPRDIWSEPP